MTKFNITTAVIITVSYFVLSQVLSLSILLAELIHLENPILYRWCINLIPLFSTLILFFIVILHFKNTKFHVIETRLSLSLPLLIVSILCGVFIVYIQTPLNYLYQYLPGVNHFDGFNKEVLDFKIYFLPKFISSIILIPIIEEFIFRKLIFGNLILSNNILISIIYSSLLFASIHLPDVSQFYTTILGGSIAAILFYKSSNQIIYPIVFHVTWNLIVYLSRFILFFNF